MKIDVHLTEADLTDQLRHDVQKGLNAQPKWLPPKWFYDKHGSDLFELITKLPEYYPTRAEREILQTRAGDIARISDAKTMVELGSGSSDKSRLLLDALHAHGTIARFVPLDVSEATLRAAAEAIDTDYPHLEVHAIVGDFTNHLEQIPADDGRLVAFLGGTIGNLPPDERAEFFARLRSTLNRGEWLLLGTDMVKSKEKLVAAYDDVAGVTAEFNRNVLRVLNRELDADFNVEAFDHVALWDDENEWIEMRLRARHDMTVQIAATDMTIGFAAGEELRTEISAKFRRPGMTAELARAGFTGRHWWTDPGGRFALTLAAAE